VWLTSAAHLTVTSTSASTFDAIVPFPPNETVSGPSPAPAAPAQTSPTESKAATTICQGRRITVGVSAADSVAASLTSGVCRSASSAQEGASGEPGSDDRQAGDDRRSW